MVRREAALPAVWFEIFIEVRLFIEVFPIWMMPDRTMNTPWENARADATVEQHQRTVLVVYGLLHRTI